MERLLKELKIKAEVISHEDNGIVSRYYLRLLPGGKLSTLEHHSREIALGMCSYNVPIIKTITEKGLVSLEFITQELSSVDFFEIVPKIDGSLNIPIILGRTYSGEDLIIDLSQAPNLLIAGSTGSGKSSLLHSIICSTFYHPNTKLILIDPKMVEFSNYSNIENLLCPTIMDYDGALKILDELIEDMNFRFSLLLKAKVNNIIEYNKKKSPLPYILLIIDEFADLITVHKKDFQDKISELAQKSRAAGIHLIISTQRPSANIINGVIKSNFPSRISCMVSSMTDSRVILDKNGAERLLGKGDSLLDSVNYNMLRFKGAWIAQDDIKNLVKENRKTYLDKILGWLK